MKQNEALELVTVDMSKAEIFWDISFPWSSSKQHPMSTLPELPGRLLLAVDEH